MSKYCDFLIDRGGFFTTNYECKRTGNKISSDVFSTYCSKEYEFRNCPNFQPPRDQGGGGCYLTTACVQARGLPDDCEELTILRDFRDHWLVKQPGGDAEIRHYYVNAPKVVKAILAAEDAQNILDELYEQMVCRCVDAIKCDNFEQAHRIYREQTLALEEKFLY